MKPLKYAGKRAYHGEIALNYERDRMKEAVWAEEQEFVSRWVATLPANASILDLPTGTGRFIGLFLQRNLRVHAMDISEDMLAEVRKSYPEGPNLSIEQGDAEHLALADNAVDYLISWRLFHLIPLAVINRVLVEFRRVCRELVVIQVFAVDCSPASPSWLGKIKGLLRPIFRRVANRSPVEPKTPWSHIPSFCHHEEHLLAAFSKAGFAVQKVHQITSAEGAPAKVYFLARRANSSNEGNRPV